MTNKVSLVLEGGGLRGAYTAGCLSWLIDNDIRFTAHYGISTGAINLCSFLLEDKKMLHDIACKYIADKSAIGIRSFFKTGRIVSYDILFNDVLEGKLHYDFDSLRNTSKIGKVGLYSLNEGKTIYFNVQDLTRDHLKAACTLPIIGKVVKINNQSYFDGGITEMIPIKEAVFDGNEKHLVITTKPSGYKRKSANPLIVSLMKALYPICPEMAADYKIRHLNYIKQINMIKDLENDKKAVYIYPSEKVDVSRMSGDETKLQYLFDLGYKDMENKKDEIKKLFE